MEKKETETKRVKTLPSLVKSVQTGNVRKLGRLLSQRATCIDYFKQAMLTALLDENLEIFAMLWSQIDKYKISFDEKDNPYDEILNDLTTQWTNESKFMFLGKERMKCLYPGYSVCGGIHQYSSRGVHDKNRYNALRDETLLMIPTVSCANQKFRRQHMAKLLSLSYQSSVLARLK